MKYVCYTRHDKTNFPGQLFDNEDEDHIHIFLHKRKIESES